MKPLLDLVHSHKSGESVGIHCVCSSHPSVLEATLRLALVSVPGMVFEAHSTDQYMPPQFAAYRDGQFKNDPRAHVLGGCARACGPAASLDDAHIHRGTE